MNHDGMNSQRSPKSSITKVKNSRDLSSAGKHEVTLSIEEGNLVLRSSLGDNEEMDPPLRTRLLAASSQMEGR